jgi:uroporphyrinogen-III synthase
MRPQSYIKGSEEVAISLGFEPISAPMIQLKAMKDEKYDTFLKHVLNGVSDYVIFTSANGIDFTLNKVEERVQKEIINALNRTKVVAIGPTTKKRLTDIGVEVIAMPEEFSSEGLVEYLCPDVMEKTVDIARSYYGSKLLIEGLKKCNANVLETKVYTLTDARGSRQEKLIRLAISGDIDVYTFTSSMMVRSFVNLVEEMNATEKVRENMANSIVAAIGVPTANTLKEYGINVDVTPERYTFKDILEHTASALKNRNS